MRTAEHRNSWDTEGNSDRRGSFFDFIKGGIAQTSAPSYVEDDLDRGWENFDGDDGYPSGYPDDYSSNYPSGPVEDTDRRVYSDGLYGNEQPYSDEHVAAGPEAGYGENFEAGFEEGFEAGYEEEFEEEGVYEADYRVIVPPSKPLDDNDNEYYPS